MIVSFAYVIVLGLKSARMSETEQEIASQPECWRLAVSLAGEASSKLPVDGERVAAIGCGTSLYMAQAYAALREAAGKGETDAFAASEFPVGRRYETVLAISRSGTTTEVARLLAQDLGSRTVAISAVEGTPVPAAADQSVMLGFADEASVVQTRFATSTLALLRAQLNGGLGPAIDQAEDALATPLAVEPGSFDHFVFLGHGWTVGLANEAALKLREAAQLHTESFPAMEYRHGPIALAGPSTLVWILGTDDARIVHDVEATGAKVVSATRDPMAELVSIQRQAVAEAMARGLDPDQPRNLTRSVVLEADP
jgi:fructoselysine-6-P-deglycase FrlB-like protein